MERLLPSAGSAGGSNASRPVRSTPHTGCGAAWLARRSGGPKVGGSNPLSPTPENPCFGGDSRRFGVGCAIDVIKDSVCQTNRVRRISLEERVVAPPQPVINDLPRKPSAHPLATSSEAEWSSASGSSLRFPVRQSDVRRSHDPGSSLCDMTSAGQQSVVSVSTCADLGLAMGSEAVRRTWTQQTFSDEFRSTRRGGRLTHRVGLCPHNDVYGLK